MLAAIYNPVWGGAKLWQRNRDATIRAWKVEIGGLFR